LLILRVLVRENWHRREAPGVASRGFKVPRCSRILLACRLVAGALVIALVLTGGPVRGQQAALPQGGDADANLLAPTLDGDPRKPPRFRARRSNDESDGMLFRQPRRLRAVPASGAGSTGFDSTNGSLRRAGSEPNPGTIPTATGTVTASPGKSPAKPKRRQNRGKAADRAPIAGDNARAKSDPLPPDRTGAPESLPPKLLQPANGPLSARFRQFRPGAPPAGPSDDTITVATVPPLLRPPPDPKPFDPLGIQAGAFLLLPAIEYSRGYDTNPARLGLPPIAGSWFNLYAPELLAASNWDRHEITAALRGSYMTFDTAHENDRPNVDGKINGRIDVTSLTRILLEGRFILSTDYPGSPNIQANLAHLPIYTTLGGSVGIDQRFNRFDVTLKGGVDRTEYQQSVFNDGEILSNTDRNYIQYSATLRTSYDLSPELRPFTEVAVNERVHELPVDRFGLDRDSDGYSAKAGVSLSIARTLTGEFGAGYLNQMYRSPLPNLGGFVVDGALAWSATALTTVKLFASTTTAESPLFLVSGVLTRGVGVQVDHAFRRWLVGTARFAVAHDIYGGWRRDDRYVASIGLSYLLTRDVWLKGEFRQEWEQANVPGSNYVASVWLLGVRLQR
jgi:hypothetical protein